MNDDYQDSYQRDDAERASILRDMELIRQECVATKRTISIAMDIIETARADYARFVKLTNYLNGCKWNDSVLAGLKPEDEKHITPDNLRAAIDQLEQP